jgi:nitrogen regulatory protein P-II 1
MKEIKAFVKLFKANDILKQLINEGFPNITVSESAGSGTFENEDKTEFTKFSSAKSKIAKIEIVCNEYDAEKIVAIISEFGRTGNPGDGIIYVSDVNKVIRVSTGKSITL